MFFLDIDDPFWKYCVSAIASKCCVVGLQNFIHAWNTHTIPSKGTPDALFAAHLRTSQIPPQFFPPAEDFAADYIRNGTAYSGTETETVVPMDTVHGTELHK